MEKFGITFYDIVGYTIPGFIGMMLLLSFAALVNGSADLMILFYKLNIVWQIGISYIAGHIIQSIVSIIWTNNYLRLIDQLKLNKYLLDTLKDNMAVAINSPGIEIGHYEILLAENNIQSEKINKKIDIFRAFQGLYKGIVGMLALGILVVIILIFIKPNYSIHYQDISYEITRENLIVIGTIMLATGFICVRRYSSFVRSRIRAIASYYVGNNE